MSLRSPLLAVIAVAMPAIVSAQHVKPTTQRSVAGIAPAPAPQPADQRSQRFGGHRGFRDDIPILVFNDGRVFADFGRGYEQVARSCALPVGYNSGIYVTPNSVSAGPVQPVVVQPSVVQPTIGVGAPLPYTPPVPAQQTPSQLMAAGAQPVQANAATGSSCWAMAPNGRIVVSQP